MPDRYIWIFLTQRDVSELFSTFSKYTPWNAHIENLSVPVKIQQFDFKKHLKKK